MLRFLPCLLFVALASPLHAAGPADSDPRFDDDGRFAREYEPVSVDRNRVLLAFADTDAGPRALLERKAGAEVHVFLVRYADDGSELRGALDLGVDAADLDAARFLPDGRVLLAIQLPEEDGRRIDLQRRSVDGALDPTFGGGDGSVIHNLTDSHLHASDVAYDVQGNVVMVGSTDPIATPPGAGRTFVATLDADGTRRANFGINGTAFLDLVANVDDSPVAAALYPNGSVLVCHHAAFVGQRDALLTRVRASGTLDTGYASSGTLYYDSSQPMGEDRDDYCRGVGLQPGTGASFIAVTSSGTDVSSGGVRLLAVDSGGSAAPSFNTIAGAYPVATLAFDRSGRPLLAAVVDRSFTNVAVKLVRYTVAGAPDAGFGIGGATSIALPLTPELTAEYTNALTLMLGTDARGRVLVGGGLGDDVAFGSAWFAWRLSGDVVLIDGFE
jgi:uncharacterized delta-60 repeat protein